MNYGYARVSTRGQKLSEQVAQLKKAGAQKIYKEKYSGTWAHKPEFDKLMKVIKPGDVLYVCKLDRLARNTQQALKIITTLIGDPTEHIKGKGVTLRVLNMPEFSNTPTGRLSYTMLVAFSQFERDLIVSRCQAGRQFAREHQAGYREGRPIKFTDGQFAYARSLRKKGWTYKAIAHDLKISESTLYKRFAKYRAEQAMQDKKKTGR